MPGLPAFLQLREVGHGRAERRHPTDGGYEVHSWAPHSLHSYCLLDSMLAPTFVSTRVSHIRWPQGSQVGACVSIISSGGIILSLCKNVEFILSGLAHLRLVLIHEQRPVELVFDSGQTPPGFGRPDKPDALRCIRRFAGPVQTVLGVSMHVACVHGIINTEAEISFRCLQSHIVCEPPGCVF